MKVYLGRTRSSSGARRDGQGGMGLGGVGPDLLAGDHSDSAQDESGKVCFVEHDWGGPMDFVGLSSSALYPAVSENIWKSTATLST